jgi:hypothetical protein
VSLPVDIDGPDIERQKKFLESLGSRRINRVNRRAISRTQTSARTEISKGVREELALKSRDVKDSISIKRPGRDDKPTGNVRIKAKPIALKRYGARTTRKGVTVKVKKSRGRSVVEGGFIVESLGGHVFIRKGKARLPISKLWGPSVVKQVEQDPERYQDFIDDTYRRRFNEQFNFELSKIYG